MIKLKDFLNSFFSGKRKLLVEISDQTLFFLKNNFSEFKKIGFFESLILVLTLIYLLCLYIYQRPFAMISIPFPFIIRKLYITEIFLLMLWILICLQYWASDKKLSDFLFPVGRFSKNRDIPQVMILFLVLFSFLRVFTDNPPTLEDGLRNIAFSYYLMFSLLYLNSLSASSIKFIAFFFCFLFFKETFNLYLIFFKDIFQIYFHASNRINSIDYSAIFIGYLYPLYYTLGRKNNSSERTAQIATVLIISLLISSFFFFGGSRTTMFGFGISWILASYLYKHDLKYFLRISISYFLLIALINLIGMPTLYFREIFSGGDLIGRMYNSNLRLLDLNFLHHAERSKIGAEIFRFTMWQDAWELFRENPLLGIGLGKQVVYRVYLGDQQFTPNTADALSRLHGMPHGSPPISGPHNSFLNILTRFGIFYFIAYCSLIFYSVKGFLIQKNYILLFVLLGTMVYAMFNVGLEGPVRGMWFFVLLGIGLKLNQESIQNE